MRCHVDIAFTTSLNGVATPSLEHAAAHDMDFVPSCFTLAGVRAGMRRGRLGLAIAARLAKAQPGANVLLVVLELCTLAFRLDQLSKANMIATALFGDGAAACVLRAGEGGIGRDPRQRRASLACHAEYLGWDVDALGFEVIFAQAIPSFAEDNFAPRSRG